MTRPARLMRWAARVTGTALFLFLTPFYQGYGLPLPRASYSFFENFHLAIMPVVLVGLVVGWWRERLAGLMICIPVALALILALATWGDPGPVALLAAVPGGLYLYCGLRRVP